MQVGDIIKFSSSGYCGVILGFTSFNGVRIFVLGEEVSFPNPTIMGANTLQRNAKVISSAETNTQSEGRRLSTQTRLV